LTSTTGAVSGTFVYPPGGRSSFTYKGAVVDGVGYGFYKDPANKETGPIWLGTPPSPAAQGGDESGGAGSVTILAGGGGSSVSLIMLTTTSPTTSPPPPPPVGEIPPLP
jgi:hypothetical protein